jgi:fatty aldehyde-generating acyl-ACP reductase
LAVDGVGLPFLGRKPTFGFIVHPRDNGDIFRARCLSLLRALSANDEDFVSRVRRLPPTIIGEILFGFAPFRGELISIGQFPDEVTSAHGREEILRAAHILVDRGARIIGLGAITAPATNGGAWLADRLPGHVTITNGNAYTAAVLRQNVLQIKDGLAACDRPSRVAILGCTGSAGSALSRLLAESCPDLILIGRTVSKVRQMFGDTASEATFSDSLADLAAAQIIVALTSDASGRLTPELMRAGSVVIDAAEPANISDEDALAWREHVTVVRGGRVQIPDYHCTYDFGFEEATETFACLAETYLFAREGICDHSVGAADAGFAKRLERAALRHRVRPTLRLPDVLRPLSRVHEETVSVDANDRENADEMANSW